MIWPSLSILWKLYTIFFNIGLLCFGGGYAAVQLAQDQTVYVNHWLTPGEFSSIVTIAEMTPGPIALNVASFVGTKEAGILGAIIATIGLISAPCLITAILAYMYQRYQQCPAVDALLKGIKPAVLGMLICVTTSFIILSMNKPPQLAALEQNSFTFNPLTLAVIGLSAYALNKKIIGPLTIIFLTGFTSLIIEFLFR
ncbi:MAG: chromate transporter [Candidatus Bruticola sp.]